MPKRPAKYDALLNHRASVKETAIAAALAPLDAVASDIEARWGCDRLEGLVSPDTAMKLASARKRLDDAIDAGEPSEVAARATVLIRGWKAVEKEALAAGHVPFECGTAWGFRHEDGTPYLFTVSPVKFDVAPGTRVWTMAEVVRVLHQHYDLVNQTKELFTGATVVAAPKAPKINFDEDARFERR